MTENPTSKKADHPVTWKALLVGGATFLTAMAAMVTVHSLLVIPSILERADERFRDELDRRMEQHEKHPHAESATWKQVDARFDDLITRIDKLATQEGLTNVDRRLDGIDARLRELERDKK